VNAGFHSETPSFIRAGDAGQTHSWISSVEFAPEIAALSEGNHGSASDAADDEDAAVGTAGEQDGDEGDEGDGIELEILTETRVLERADTADVAAVEV